MTNYVIASPDGIPWLTLLLLSPVIGILLLGLSAVLRLDERLTRNGAALWSLTSLGLALVVAAHYNPSLVADGQGVVQLAERVPWIQAIRVDYFLGVDGISLPLVLLTSVMTPVAMLASFGVSLRPRAHYALLFLLQAAMLGYFLALDFFFFFIFWEFSLVPAFFLINSWGRERRNYAAFKFFVYTMAGSLGLLLLFQYIYQATRFAGTPTFDLVALGRLGRGLDALIDGRLQTESLQQLIFLYSRELGLTNLAWLGNFPLVYTSIAFWAIFIAFAIKLAVWPFHTWLPDAYTEAPAAGSILLSAVMSKMGAYGMLRLLLPLVPEAAQYFAYALGALALIGIVAGAYGALREINGDLKRLIAYTSINHMGYVMLGIAAAAALPGGASGDSRAIALNGVMMQLVAHGLSTGALFYLAEALYRRTGSYNLSDWGGLRTAAPGLANLMGVATFANLGLPGLAGFVGEFFIFRGAWATLPLFTLLATLGLVITALALLQMYRRIFYGPLNARWSKLPDITPLELLATLPLLAVLFALGLYPAPLMDLGNATLTALVETFLNRLI